MNKAKIQSAVDCFTTAKTFRTLDEFKALQPHYYELAFSNSWLPQCQALIDYKGSIDLLNLLKKAASHGDIFKWQKSAPVSYQKAKKLGLLAFCIDYIGVVHSHLSNNIIKEYISSFHTRKALTKNAAIIYKRCTNDEELISFMNAHFGHARRVKIADCDFNTCLQKAQEVASLAEYKQNRTDYYQQARTQGWLQDIRARCQWESHFEENKLQKLIESAKRFKTRSDWIRACHRDYLTAFNLGVLNQCCAHMIPKSYKRSKPTTWTKKKCQDIAMQFKTRTQWSRNHPNSYQAARKKQWLDDCTEHMIQLRKPKLTIGARTEAII